MAPEGPQGGCAPAVTPSLGVLSSALLEVLAATTEAVPRPAALGPLSGSESGCRLLGSDPGIPSIGQEWGLGACTMHTHTHTHIHIHTSVILVNLFDLRLVLIRSTNIAQNIHLGSSVR